MENKSKPKISVVVPAYCRPDFLKILINSYLLQSFKNAELIIIDDSPIEKSLEPIVKDYSKDNKTIEYIRNDHNLGFCKNLLKSINSANGEYLLILGDDDLLGDENTLEEYVEIFQKHPDVGLVYSNQIQFNNNYITDYVYKHFNQDTYCKNTEDSLQKVWLLTCFISGIGLRNNLNFTELYPEKNILFPQVELIGKILGTQNAYGISKYLIGSRAHNEQLGFKAVNKKNIKDDEKHSAFELNMIYQITLDFYKSKLKKQISLSKDFVNIFFENKHMTIFPSEKINTSNWEIIKVFKQAFSNNYKVIFNLPFMFYFLISLILPSKILYIIKEWKKKDYLQQFNRESDKFNIYLNKLCKMKQ